MMRVAISTPKCLSSLPFNYYFFSFSKIHFYLFVDQNGNLTLNIYNQFYFYFN